MITDGLSVRTQAQDIAASRWGVFTKVAAVQGADNLAEDTPDELLLAHLVLVLEVADDAPQVAIAAVFHVQVKVLGNLDVVALEVCDNVGVSKLFEDGQLGLQLFAFLGRHLLVADFLPAEDL
jgi:hypothetical protein